MSRLVVIGGHTRNIGKTGLVVELLRAFPEARWLAAKITQFGHGVCSRNGEQCGCAEDEHTVAVDVETDRAGRTDTSRFLLAGAERVLWVRTKQGRLAEALPELRREMERFENVILESNTVLGFLRPDLYIPVLDFSQTDFKASARQVMDRAHAFVVVDSGRTEAEWEGVSLKWLRERPVFRVRPQEMCPAELREFVRHRLFAG